MTPDLLSSDHKRQFRTGENAPMDSVAQERLMLLELATDLRNWPARNLVFRDALDRAAQDLLAMASAGERGQAARQPASGKRSPR